MKSRKRVNETPQSLNKGLKKLTTANFRQVIRPQIALHHLIMDFKNPNLLQTWTIRQLYQKLENLPNLSQSLISPSSWTQPITLLYMAHPQANLNLLRMIFLVHNLPPVFFLQPMEPLVVFPHQVALVDRLLLVAVYNHLLEALNPRIILNILNLVVSKISFHHLLLPYPISRCLLSLTGLLLNRANLIKCLTTSKRWLECTNRLSNRFCNTETNTSNRPCKCVKK